jgi:colanic acid biosynthesis protein WcaH
VIAKDFYSKIVEVIPILCVDIVIKNELGQFLLIQRNNQPLKNIWWVIGGRVKKGELILNACKRKVFEEVGINLNHFEHIGYYEEVFSVGPFSNNSYHTLSLVFEAKLDSISHAPILLDDQSAGWGWFDSLPKQFKITNSTDKQK